MTPTTYQTQLRLKSDSAQTLLDSSKVKSVLTQKRARITTDSGPFLNYLIQIINVNNLELL